MFNKNKIINCLAGIAICLLALTSFIACSGGDSMVAGGGIGGTGITIGAVSGFGSIFVNGIEYDTSTAEIIVEGAQIGVGDQSVLDNLSVGKVVRIEGPIPEDYTGAASRVVYNDNVEGPVDNITNIDSHTKEVIVMGQPVIVDDLTSFENTSFDLIAKGNVLEVSGHIYTEGFVYATYVEKKADFLAPDAPVDLKGIVQDLDTLSETFKINTLTIDYSLVDTNSLSSGNPANGQLLEVKGTLDSNDTLVASSIEVEDELGRDDADTADVEGIVTEFFSISEFYVGNHLIKTDALTVFEGMLPEDIDVGTKLVVTGALKDRILLADKIKSREKVKLESNVANVNPFDDTLTLSALETIAIILNELTKIQGDVSQINDIQVADHVRIFGRVLSDGSVLAARVFVKSSSDDKVKLKGPVESISEPNIVILSITIDSTFIPDDGFEMSDGTPITPVEFFAMVREDDIVNVKGTFDGIDLIWNGIELEKAD